MIPAKTPEKKQRSKSSRFVIIFFFIILAAFGLLVYLDWQNLKDVIYKANLLIIIPAIIFSILSYLASSWAFVMICRIFNIKTDTLGLIKLGFITISIGNLLDLGGVGGYALRISYLKEKNVPVKDVLAISLLHTYLGFINLLILLVFGLGYLFYTGNIAFEKDPAAFYGLGIALIIVSVLTVLLLLPKLRKPVLEFISKIIQRFTNENIDRKVEEFHEGLNQGLATLRNKSLNTLKLFGMFQLCWLLAVVSLFFCFQAFGQTIAPGALVAGFSVGIFTGMFSFIPGGVGAQDGSMSAIFAIIGVPFTTALLVALLFRFVFNIFPNLISLVLYGGLLGED